jgi:hypothetical protein
MATLDEELVARLRREWPVSTLNPMLGSKPVNPDGPKAADRIEALLKERDAALRGRDKVIGLAADALDIADALIDKHLGTDTPKEWDRAFRRVANARAALNPTGKE